MALLWPVDEDSLLFQACMAVGLFVVVAEAALPAVLGRLRLRQPLRAPLLPAREFQRRKRELQHEARALQLDVAAARSLHRQRRRSRTAGDREAGISALEAVASRRMARRRIKPAKETKRETNPVNEDRAQRERSSVKKRKTSKVMVRVAPTKERQSSASRGDAVKAGVRLFVPPKPMVLVEAIETPPKIQLRGAVRHAHEGLQSSASANEGGRNSSERKQRLVYWESAADLFRRDSLSVAATTATAAAQAIVNDASQSDDKTSTRGEQAEQVQYQTRGEAKQEDDELDHWPATRPHRSISVRLGVSADLDASDSSESVIGSLIGARQRVSRGRRPLPASHLPEPRQPRFVSQFVTIASAEPRSEVLPDNTRASAVSRWSSHAPSAEAEERKEEGGRAEEELNGGADVMMMDLDTTRQNPGAVIATGMRLQTTKRTREQAFAPASRLHSPLSVALPDATTPKIVRRIAFDDDSVVETPAVDRTSGKKRKPLREGASKATLPPLPTGLINHGER